MEHHTITTSNVSRGTFDNARQLYLEHSQSLDHYLDRLLWWNSRVNLVSRNVPRETIQNHIRHSLLVSQFAAFQAANLVVDAGTGGGLPGIPLAMAYPDKHFVLNDIVSKKCLAIKQMVRHLGLINTSIANTSIADIQQARPFLLVSKHAFKINELYAMTVRLPWDTLILYKGMEFKEELEGIDEALHIHRYDLSDGPEFYANKALLIISRGKTTRKGSFS